MKTFNNNYKKNHITNYITMPVYFLDISDTTNYATMFYSPNRAKKIPGFANSSKTEEVFIEGVDSQFFRFYKYIGDVDPYVALEDRIWREADFTD